MSDDLIKALQKEAREDAEIITFLRAANEKLNVTLDGCRKKALEDADEITRLRAENKGLREALSYYAEEHYNGYNGNGACARAALEGVTKKEGAGNE